MNQKPNRSSQPAWVRLSAIAIVGVWASASVAHANNGSVKHYSVNEPGNVLIADQFNNRVVETDPNGNILWQFV